jgi:hypothetical protein
MCRFDLDADNPAQKHRLCDLPRDILALGPINRWYTHLTLTADRTRAFLDISVFGKRWIQGLLRFSEGSFEKWSETDFPCGHAQINPVNDRIAYAGRSRPGWHRVPDTRKGAKPGDTRLVKIPPGTPYPCMWLLRPGERPRMIPSRDINHSTHQNWTEDGKGWYWCSRIPGKEKHWYARWGVYYYDLATDSETKVSDVQAGHAAMTADRSAITYDWGEWVPELNGYQFLRGDYMIESSGEQVTSAYRFRTDSTLQHNVLATMPQDTLQRWKRQMQSVVQQYMQRMTADQLTLYTSPTP